MSNMDREDTFSTSGEQAPSGGGSPSGRVSIDRFEMKQQFLERSEEEQVEAAAVLYEKAVRQWLPPAPEAPSEEDSEELEARSQELKLRQMCQGIAALVMVDEMEDSSDEDEDE